MGQALKAVHEVRGYEERHKAPLVVGEQLLSAHLPSLRVGLQRCLDHPLCYVLHQRVYALALLSDNDNDSVALLVLELEWHPWAVHLVRTCV